MSGSAGPSEPDRAYSVDMLRQGRSMKAYCGWRPFAAVLLAVTVCCAAAECRAQDTEQPAPESQPADTPAEPQSAEPSPQDQPVEQPAQAPVAYPGLGTPTVKVGDARDHLDLAFDLGAGFLEFIHLDVTWLISRQWSVGIGAGFFPIEWALRKLMGVDDLSAAASLAGLTLSGEVETTLGSGRIFGRWYPWKKRFFTELSAEMWRLIVKAEGSLTAITEQLVEVKTTAKVWVPMIGLHAGWRFLWENGFYIDLAGGVNLLLSPGAEVTLGGATVDQVSEIPEGEAALATAQEFLSDELEKGANRITKKIKIFPTAALRFGWAFDFW